MASTFLVIVGRSSLVLVANLTPVLEAARYSVAFRFLDLELMLAQTLGFALLPAMGARAGHDQQQGAALARKFLFVFVGASLVVVPIAVLITPTVLVFCFGETYAGRGPRRPDPGRAHPRAAGLHARLVRADGPADGAA